MASVKKSLGFLGMDKNNESAMETIFVFNLPDRSTYMNQLRKNDAIMNRFNMLDSSLDTLTDRVDDYENKSISFFSSSKNGLPALYKCYFTSHTFGIAVKSPVADVH